MTDRSERFEILIQATPEEVWRCLTTAEGIAAWFGTHSEIDLQIGGIRKVAWGDGTAFDGEIKSIEPLERLEIVYMEGGVPTGAEEWLITAEERTTRLTLINSMSDDGIDDWDGFYGDIRRGWRLFMESMRFALEKSDTVERLAVCDYLPTAGSRDEVWETAIAPTLASHLVDGMVETFTDQPHSALATAHNRSLLLDVEGSGSGQVLFVQAAVHGSDDSTWIDEALAAVRTRVNA